MAEVTQSAVLVSTRLGPIRPFVFVAPASEPLSKQAGVLFEAFARSVEGSGGWLIETLVAGGSAGGFAKLMERRAAGELPWEKVVPHEAPPGRAGLLRPTLACRKPYTMLARLGCPCWAAQGHLYTIDLFNPANELMFPYEDERYRLWSVIPWPPRFKMPDGVYSQLLQDTAIALQADYAFGGPWVAEAALAYVFSDEFLPFDSGTRIMNLTYPNVIARTRDLPADGIERLGREVRVGSRSWKPAVCREFGDGAYVFVSTTADYGDENVHVGRAVAEILGKPYVADKLARSAQDS